MKKFKNNFWFTLVELIVVMIIISVISTIVFFSYKDYFKETRDAVRLNWLTIAEDILWIYRWENWYFPTPEWPTTTETDGSGVVWTVWRFWVSATQNIKAAYDLPVDPKTKEKYIYKLSLDGDIYKIIAETELSGDVIATNQKEEFDPNAPTSPTIIIDWPYLNPTSNHTFRYVTKTWPDINCNLPDLQILDSSWALLQTWAWCNSTLKNWVEWWEDNWDEIISPGIDYCYNYNWSYLGSWTNPYCLISSPIMKSTNSAVDYFNSVLWLPLNTYGDREYSSYWWKLYTYKMSNSYSSIACPSWWRVPTTSDFIELLTSLWCSSPVFDWSNQCSWLWWRGHSSLSSSTNLTRAFRLPLSWYYVNGAKKYSYRGRYATLITSNRPSYYNINTITVEASRYTLKLWEWDKNNAYSLRCIKELD